jgi:hypothetical protein
MPLGLILDAVANVTRTVTRTVISAAPAKLTPAAANATRTAISAVPAQLAPAVPAANSTSVSGLVPAFTNFVATFETNATAVLLTLDTAEVDIGRAAVVFLVIAGVILWFTHVNKRIGKDLLVGGIILGVFVEFVVPFLMSLNL